MYEGKVGKELHRPAFTQELTFDLADGDVGAKGARIQVMKATNIDIEYRVLQPFSP